MKNKTTPLITTLLSILALAGCGGTSDEPPSGYEAINIDGVRCIAAVGLMYSNPAIDCDWDGTERGDQ